MNIDEATLKKLLGHVAATSSLGLVLGAVVGVVSFSSQMNFEKRLQSLKGGDVTNLRSNPEFLEALLDLTPYRSIEPPRSEVLFDKMLRSCDSLVQCDLKLRSGFAPGVVRFTMNRHLRQLKDASAAMERICRNKLKDGSSGEDRDRLFAEYSTFSEALITCGDNLVHNAILTDTAEMAPLPPPPQARR